ncbi:MAG: cobalt ECF transporter T component CbiQ [Bacteroidales bacterium]
MPTLQNALNELDRMEVISANDSLLHRIDARAKLTVTVVFLVSMLSLPLDDITDLLPFFIYPILLTSLADISLRFISVRSLIVLPFIIFIGIFNPLLQRNILFYIGDVPITEGWVSFISILLRGILSVQAALLLILTTGFYKLCRGMERMGLPSLFSTQLLFVYRYIFVLIQESIIMSRARDSRSFGKKGFSIKTWGVLTGQLMIRTFERAERIHNAMISRGFTGNIKGDLKHTWNYKDTFYLIGWSLFFILLRFLMPVSYLVSFL